MQKNHLGSHTFSRQTLHQQILRHLGTSIVRGGVKAGETLPSEPELCVQLNVSRIALREALKVLAAKGLVESRPKTGTLVRPRSAWNLLDPDVLAWLQEIGPDDAFLRDLIDVRLVIEPAAARRAARHATDADIGALEAWYRRMEIAIHDVDTFIRADLEFHGMILTAAHNELLQQLGNTIRVALRASRAITTQLPGASEGAMPLHWAVLDAIRNKNEDVAERAMIDLIMAAQSDIDHVLHSAAD
jgi:DNA-binding FadR family transcriptional regulator